MEEVARYSGCFVCGDNNNIGLKAHFFYEDGQVTTDYTAEKRFEGYLGVLHGGITSALLDEVMIKALLAREIFAMTVELTVRFKKSVSIGEHLHLKGFVTAEKGRLFSTQGEMVNGEGEVVATATGKYLEVRGNKKSELMKSLED
jgi:uncharacterized protein (TIGR00369 family)